MRPPSADPAEGPGDRSGEGPLVVYFHGAPGSPREMGLILGPAKRRGVTPVCLHRFVLAPALTGEQYFDALADELRLRAAGRAIDVIGFSIGAFVALQVCRRLGSQVRGADLVSPAGPLESGDFLDQMAGGALFRMARQSPTLFRLVSRVQGLVAAWRPATLVSMLFAQAAGEDRDLVKDTRFKTLLGAVLKDSLGRGVAGYVRDVEAYVRPWADGLSEVKVPVRIWQGALDNWSPPAMAEALGRLLPGAESVQVLAGRSHYSCLLAAAPDIFRRLGEAAASDGARGGD